jgi:taurine dioxygenase
MAVEESRKRDNAPRAEETPVTTTTVPEVELVAGALGAVIRGIDLNELTDDGFELIHDRLLKHQVVFVAGQHNMVPAAHIALGRRFGEVELHPYLPRLEGYPEIVIIDSENGGKVDVWHTDMTFHQSPPIASILHLVQVPTPGGDTMFTNQCLVYERLSAPLRDFLDGLTAIHAVRADNEYSSRAEHPVVRVHPETGRRSLYVNRLFTSHIPQLTRNESDALLEHLFRFSEGPQFTCRYHWCTGDVAIWDNRVTMHYAVNDYTAIRRGQRITVLGDHPTGNEPRWEHYAPAPGERYWPDVVNSVEPY